VFEGQPHITDLVGYLSPITTKPNAIDCKRIEKLFVYCTG